MGDLVNRAARGANFDPYAQRRLHNPPCDTWQIHLRHSFLAIDDKFVSLRSFLDDVLYTWDTELLVNDPDFWRRYDAMTDETRQAMDTARAITSSPL